MGWDGLIAVVILRDLWDTSQEIWVFSKVNHPFLAMPVLTIIDTDGKAYLLTEDVSFYRLERLF